MLASGFLVSSSLLRRENWLILRPMSCFAWLPAISLPVPLLPCTSPPLTFQDFQELGHRYGLTVGTLLRSFCPTFKEQVLHRKYFYQTATLLKEGIMRLSGGSFDTDMNSFMCTIDRRMLVLFSLSFTASFIFFLSLFLCSRSRILPSAWTLNLANWWRGVIFILPRLSWKTSFFLMNKSSLFWMLFSPLRFLSLVALSL